MQGLRVCTGVLMGSSAHVRYICVFWGSTQAWQVREGGHREGDGGRLYSAPTPVDFSPHSGLWLHGLNNRDRVSIEWDGGGGNYSAQCARFTRAGVGPPRTACPHDTGQWCAGGIPHDAGRRDMPRRRLGRVGGGGGCH